ncbi:LOW QUALITY PROTEIN: general transcription factor IIIA, b [Nerophis lumbriciformis]|uniref:LOW QUALITY PROTEIN: general transcription factor IIIA, b n=1 Tax=Nerophis lumbriciformis TaxID=546530 RepID=UPI003BAA292B
MGERLQAPRSYTCTFLDCKATFSKSWKLDAHLCKHTGQNTFTCESCDQCFSSRYLLDTHQLLHSQTHRCLVEECSEVLAGHGSLKKHTAGVHKTKTRTKSLRASSWTSAEHHVVFLLQHLVLLLSVREGCKKDFKKKFQLKAHMGEHQDLLPFHCLEDGCRREFSSLGKLRHHKKVHTGYQCQEDLCAFLGKTWSEYQKHRSQHRVKLVCQTCEKTFNIAWFLRQHERRRHGGDKRCFACPREDCDKTFGRRFHLDSHVLGDHEGKKNFSCAVVGCGRSFAMKESLWRHGVMHDPLKKKMVSLSSPSCSYRSFQRRGGAQHRHSCCLLNCRAHVWMIHHLQAVRLIY